MKVRFYAGTKYVGSKVEEEIEFEDDLSDDELYEELEDWVDNNVYSGFVIIDE